MSYRIVSDLVEMILNHALVNQDELNRAMKLKEMVSTGHGSSDEVTTQLHELATTLTNREVGAPIFEGISLRWFERAVRLAERSVPEDSGLRPRVGAVILRDDELLSQASRNEDNGGGHAEQLAVEIMDDHAELIGSTVLTTLEPCTNRGSRGRRPCAEILLRYRVGRVMIGLPDPNPVIRGRGDLLLRQNGIEVGYFPSGMAKRIWELNRTFIDGFTRDAFRQVFVYRD